MIRAACVRIPTASEATCVTLPVWEPVMDLDEWLSLGGPRFGEGFLSFVAMLPVACEARSSPQKKRWKAICVRRLGWRSLSLPSRLDRCHISAFTAESEMISNFERA